MGTDDYPEAAAELAGTLLLVYWLVAPRAISHIQWEHTVTLCAELTWVVELLPQKNGGNEANQQQHDSNGKNHRCISMDVCAKSIAIRGSYGRGAN